MLADTTPDAQHFAADQLNALRNTMELHFLERLAEIDSSESWKPDGAPSMEHWVSVRYGMSWEAAHREVELCRTLPSLPAIAEAFSDGLLSKEKVIALCSFVAADVDAWWASEAQRLTAAQVRRAARMVRRLRREDADALDRKRALHLHWDLDSDVLRISGVLPGADGALFKNAIEHIASRPKQGPDGEWPSLSERQADALVELAAQKIEQVPSGARSTVVVHVDARELNHVHGMASLEAGPLVPSEVVRRLACDGSLQAVIHAEDGTPIGIGRRSRIIPKWLERQVRERDRACVCCGSTLTVGSEIHHVIPWARGGPTDLGNLVLVCRRCHRLIHDRCFGLRKNSGGTYTLTQPSGRIINNRPAKLSPDIKARMIGPPNRTERPVALRC